MTSGYKGGNGPAWRIVKATARTILCLGGLALVGVLLAWRG